MKITDLIDELVKIKLEFGDIDIIYSRNVDDIEIFCYLEKTDLFVVSDKKLDKTNVIVLNPWLLSIENYNGFNNVVKHNKIIDSNLNKE